MFVMATLRYGINHRHKTYGQMQQQQKQHEQNDKITGKYFFKI
jgi:hypothetical protein